MKQWYALYVFLYSYRSGLLYFLLIRREKQKSLSLYINGLAQYCGYSVANAPE